MEMVASSSEVGSGVTGQKKKELGVITDPKLEEEASCGPSHLALAELEEL